MRGLNVKRAGNQESNGYSKIKLLNVTAEPVSGVNAWLYLR
jgi:hypothetical protein